jgi:hypothetical protein
MRRALVGLVLVVALAASAGAASATTVCVGGTCTGGAFTLTASGQVTSFHGSLGGFGFTCTSSQISGVAPATSATAVSIPVTLSFSGCGAFGFGGSITEAASCQDRITLKIMYNQATAPQATASLTVPPACTITVTTPAGHCPFTASGEQTIGATGGMTWTNGASTLPSSLALSSALVPSVTLAAGANPACTPPGATTEITLSTSYRVTSPGSAPGVTVLP